jgi:hypothetical protein
VGSLTKTSWTKETCPKHAGPGRPAKTDEQKAAEIELKQLTQRYTTEAVDCLLRLMKEPKVPARVQLDAAREILDRGWGKAVQPIAGPDGGPVGNDICAPNVVTVYSGVLAKHDETR